MLTNFLKTMKTNIKSAFIAIISISFSLVMTACNDDDDKVTKPVVTLTEVGHKNSGTVAAGDDLHLEADIVAEGLVARIDIEIHLEEGGALRLS